MAILFGQQATLARPPSADTTTLAPTPNSKSKGPGLFCSPPQTKMAFFTIGIKLSGAWQPLYVSDVHEMRPLSFVAETVRTRRELGVSSFVHLGYERPVHGHSGPEIEVVYLSHLTTVLQAYNSILQASSFELSAVYVRTYMNTHFIEPIRLFQDTGSTEADLGKNFPLVGCIQDGPAAPPGPSVGATGWFSGSRRLGRTSQTAERRQLHPHLQPLQGKDMLRPICLASTPGRNSDPINLTLFLSNTNPK